MLKPTHLMILICNDRLVKIFALMRLITTPDGKFWNLFNYTTSGLQQNNLGYGASMSYALFLILIVLTLVHSSGAGEGGGA